MADNEQDWDAILADGKEMQNIATRMIECAKAMGASDSEEEAPEEEEGEEMAGSDEYKLPSGKEPMGREMDDASVNDVADPEKNAKKMAIIIALKKKLSPK